MKPVESILAKVTRSYGRTHIFIIIYCLYSQRWVFVLPGESENAYRF
jgi:hypothetical protein